ncbi:hypothetical protein GCM10027081_03600 [Cupriavidus yeoncheonensis]
MGGSRNLIDSAKALAFDEVLDENGSNLAYALSEALIITDSKLISALRADQDGVSTCIRLLSKAGHLEAIFALISNISISAGDSIQLEATIGQGLNGDVSGAHKWMLEYDIIGQRLEMIRSVILPYVEENCPEKRLFCALKAYEFESLALGETLIDPQKIGEVIFAARNCRNLPALSDIKKCDSLRSQTSFQLVLPNEIFNILLRLAWVAEDYVFDLIDRYSEIEFIAELRKLGKIVPVYLIPTHLGYPMGGGESFMHQTCRILSEFGVKCVWVSFLHPEKGWYIEDSVTYTPYYVDVRYAGGRCREDMQRAIDAFGPDLVHAQGGTNDAAMEIAEDCRLTTMIGYHFWSGLVDLGETGNRHILDNLENHQLRPMIGHQSGLISKYVASEFMQDVYKRLNGAEELQVLHPISDSAQFLANRDDSGTYVLQVNVCALKGGEIFLECVRALGAVIPFMGIQSEPEPSDLFTRLADEVGRHPLCELKSYGNVRDFYRTARLVIVPTLVDETFCRVAFEAAMNGIPVLSTANGYLPMMLGDAGVFLSENPAEWVEMIASLYHNETRLREIGQAQQSRLRAMFGSDFRGFIRTAMGLIDNSVNRNVGMFTIWGDQGLGNLSHTYSKLLRRVGYKVHIFSAQPYAMNGKGLVRQSNPDDWSAPSHADSIYYSLNDRENVTVHEITQFILANNVHTLIVPEICWSQNWERLFALKVNRLEICSVPMIEIVIKEEISNHNRLTSTFYCTRLAESTLSREGIKNGAFLGHGFGSPLPGNRIREKRARLADRSKLRFLHVAGHNPKTRKNTPQVIEAFSNALKLRDDIELTVTSLDSVSSYYSGELPENITIIDKSLSREEILALYEEHDVSIQVSSHEGLGLGFFESISRSTPVISLNARPHNEIVLEGRTGWLIPAAPVPVPDNARAIVDGWSFNTQDLVSKIVSLEKGEVDRMIVSAGEVFKLQFDEVALLTRFLQILPRPSAVLPTAVAEGEDPATDNSGRDCSAIAPADADTSPRALSTNRSYAIQLKPFIKRKGLKLGRWLYELARPVTRRIVLRVKALMIEANADLRKDNSDLWHDNRELRQAVANLAKMTEERFASVSWQVSGLGRTISAHVGPGIRTGSIHDADRGKMFARIANDVEFIKHRYASYAGPGMALTYLRDESPIFVNTGDLGCPSPIINGGIWEPDNLAVLYSFLTDKSVFLDIGANVGYFSIALGNRLKGGGKVFSVEPHPTLTNLLQRSLQLNGLEKVVQVFECAASDQDEILDLFFPDGHLGQGSSSRISSGRGQKLAVRARLLDDLLPADLAVDLVKIDVEGHELRVLQGMGDVLNRSPNAKILFEKLDSAGNVSDEIGEFLSGRGLALYGVGPFATLVPLELKSSYCEWVGDVLAAPSAAVDSLCRTGFSVYPNQLYGDGVEGGIAKRYLGKDGKILFAGPRWFLRKGNWKLRLHGHIRGKVRVILVEGGESQLAEFELSEDMLETNFVVRDDITHFEIQAYAQSISVIDLERIEFLTA